MKKKKKKKKREMKGEKNLIICTTIKKILLTEDLVYHKGLSLISNYPLIYRRFIMLLKVIQSFGKFWKLGG